MCFGEGWRPKTAAGLRKANDDRVYATHTGAAPNTSGVELRRQDVQRTIDSEAAAVAVAKPLSSEQKYQHADPRRVKNAERAT